MTALRELAERWKAHPGRVFTENHMLNAGIVLGKRECAAELLTILDAEGDGGAVAELVVDRDSGNREWFDIKVFDRTLPHGTKFYTHPARSGVVSDEDVIEACEHYDVNYEEGSRAEFIGMRAALEHFAKGERHER